MVVGSNLSWQGIKRKAVYTEGAGPVCKCMGPCTLEGSVILVKCINFRSGGGTYVRHLSQLILKKMLNTIFGH